MSSKLQLDLLPELGVAPSGERLRRKGRHGVFAVCDPCLSALRYTYKMALYKYSSFPFPLDEITVKPTAVHVLCVLPVECWLRHSCRVG